MDVPEFPRDADFLGRSSRPPSPVLEDSPSLSPETLILDYVAVPRLTSDGAHDSSEKYLPSTILAARGSIGDGALAFLRSC